VSRRVRSRHARKRPAFRILSRALAVGALLGAAIIVAAFVARPASRPQRPGRALATHATGLAGLTPPPRAGRPDSAFAHPRAGTASGRQATPPPGHAGHAQGRQHQGRQTQGRQTQGRPGTLAGSARPASTAAVVRVPPGTPLPSVHPLPAHTYLFKRGASYAGTLTVSADNVIIDAFGTGRYPVFSRTSAGNDVVLAGTSDFLSHIRLTGHGYRAVPRCGQARTAGYEVGVDISGLRDTVRSVHAYGNLYAGVYVEPYGGYATISHSVFDRVDALNPAGFGSGAFGVLLWGNHNTVAWDTFANQRTCSPAYGRDGSGVEIYHGSYNLIEHNTGRNDADFTELGGRGATTNTYLGNTFAAPGQFLVTRGSADSADGPVANTILIGNVAHGAVVSYDWQPGEGRLLVMRDDHVASLWQDGGYVDKGGVVIGF